MDTEELRATQAPLKDKYREHPESALVTLHADAELDGLGISCKVETGRAVVEAGLHPATGGDGTLACSGDMLLEALVACAGVTLRAVATSLGLEVRGGRVRAEGDLDFRGTLAVAKDAPVGFRAIRLSFDLDTDASEEQLATLKKLTERYCVVFQSLRTPPEFAVTLSANQG
ncbi:OsmC family protein [Amycolatopsis vancoresmycina]|uniref:OsmC family protein n=1 Tax=Amycolatopsis vancoresmycina DSM 44592 TaxID=1292037 RepID=R1FY16_9PSEU|nr:OsmC family protein [Amycolatopsis vancoresmycina]EOD64217.1 OsmC family protein [Amycolatopsis vancoresmycina DSM 44592]